MEPIELHKEQSGYVINSLLWPFLSAGLQLLVDGVADPETIDKTLEINGPPPGPFQVLDVIGLTTSYNILAGFEDEKSHALAQYIKEHYIDRGKLGVGTGEGFYKYPAAAQAREGVRAAAEVGGGDRHGGGHLRTPPGRRVGRHDRGTRLLPA